MCGKAEVQRAGHQQWQFANSSTKLYNNDIIRVLDNGLVRLNWPDGSTMFIHQNSQVLINLIQVGSSKGVTSNITVFFGALYFIIKKIAPRELLPTATKIYTPTTVISLRGTSFAVFVSKKNGGTTVKMINGTVLVRNILKNVSLFLNASYKTYIEMNTDPIVPDALLKTDIDSLKLWVPPHLIDEEIASQLVKSKRDYHILTGKFEDRLIVLPLVNNSSYTGPWQINSVIPSLLATELKKSLVRMNISMIDTQKVDPLEIGKINKARFVITGVIENFDLLQHAEISARADEYREYIIGKIKLRIQLLDAAENKLICEETFTGEVSGKNKPENTWPELNKIKCTVDNKDFTNSLMGGTIRQSIDQAVEKIARYLEQ